MKISNRLHKIQIVSDATAATTEPCYLASYVDFVGDGFRSVANNVVGALTGATAVDAVPVMANGTLVRDIESLSIFNRDTASRTITVNLDADGTDYVVFKATLGASESMHYNGREWKVITAAGEVKASTLGSQTSTAGTKNGSTVTASETSFGPFHQTVLTCTATPVTITDDAGVAQYGGAGKLYTFPEGLINTLGAVVSGNVTLGTTGTVINTWAGGVALGTEAATTGATLAGTEADIMPEVDVAAATAKVAAIDAVSVATALTESGARWLDGTTTAKECYLNLVVDDDATHTSGTGTFTGTVTLTWVKLGDNA